jgi:DNA (cytosine-5)-methyltransferase 1
VNGLDLFSGIGAVSLALRPWVRTVAYCEILDYRRRVLVSRMEVGELETAPVWDDVRTLDALELAAIGATPVDIIFGGFPCQDLSCAGRGAGLAGERSGLFFEIMRLAGELRPRFVFLENVPAIRTRGAAAVGAELARLGYDCRWDHLSAYDMGAPHLRDRWFCLAHNASFGKREPADETDPESACRETRDESLCGGESITDSYGVSVRFESWGRCRPNGKRPAKFSDLGATGEDSYPDCSRELQPQGSVEEQRERAGNTDPRNYAPDASSIGRCSRREESAWHERGSELACDPDRQGLAVRQGERGDPQAECEAPFRADWWAVEPDLVRMVHGFPFRVDRISALGNANPPAQYREAFMRLMGFSALAGRGEK